MNAIFFTHMHNDHSEGFADLLQHRWLVFPTSPKIDVVCSDDVASPLGFTVSCRKFVAHIADAQINSGEIAQRMSEDKRRPAAGPAALANLQDLRAEERAAAGLGLRRREGQRDPLHPYSPDTPPIASTRRPAAW